MILPDIPENRKPLLRSQTCHVGRVHSDTVGTSWSRNLLHVGGHACNFLAQIFQVSLCALGKIPVCENCRGKLNEHLSGAYLARAEALLQHGETVNTLGI